MRHHSQNVAAFIADAGNIIERSVRIRFSGYGSFWRCVAEDDTVLALQRLQRLRIAIIIPFHVADGNPQDFTVLAGVGEWCVGVFHAQVDKFTDVLQSRVAHERAGKQAGFAENLEAIADADNQSASNGKFSDLLHDGRKLGDGARTQIVTIGKSAGHNNGVTAL